LKVRNTQQKKAGRIARVIVLSASTRDQQTPFNLVPTRSAKDGEKQPLAMSDI